MTEAEEIARGLSVPEIDAMRVFANITLPIPWGAWLSAVMEDLYLKRLIVSESDATFTPLGRAVASILETSNDRT